MSFASERQSRRIAFADNTRDASVLPQDVMCVQYCCYSVSKLSPVSPVEKCVNGVANNDNVMQGGGGIGGGGPKGREQRSIRGRWGESLKIGRKRDRGIMSPDDAGGDRWGRSSGGKSHAR